jgi:hypothetical protein
MLRSRPQPPVEGIGDTVHPAGGEHWRRSGASLVHDSPGPSTVSPAPSNSALPIGAGPAGVFSHGGDAVATEARVGGPDPGGLPNPAVPTAVKGEVESAGATVTVLPQRIRLANRLALGCLPGFSDSPGRGSPDAPNSVSRVVLKLEDGRRGPDSSACCPDPQHSLPARWISTVGRQQIHRSGSPRSRRHLKRVSQWIRKQEKAWPPGR